MYNEYEDYMRSVLGYTSNQVMLHDTYGDSYSNMNYFPYRAYSAASDELDEKRYEGLYPEIYRILKPMVNKICDNVSIGDISQERLEAMVNEIYTNIEADTDIINVNIKTEQTTNKMQRSMKVTEQPQEHETRTCCKNQALGDLIKILLLQQLTNNCHNKPGGCKPFPPGAPRPPRPPMPPQYLY